MQHVLEHPLHVSSVSGGSASSMLSSSSWASIHVPVRTLPPRVVEEVRLQHQQELAAAVRAEEGEARGGRSEGASPRERRVLKKSKSAEEVGRQTWWLLKPRPGTEGVRGAAKRSGGGHEVAANGGGIKPWAPPQHSSPRKPLTPRVHDWRGGTPRRGGRDAEERGRSREGERM
eukprot:3723555-Rhodomonas_salina.1